MIYIAVGLTVALFAADLFDLSSRKVETRRQLGER